MPTEFLRAVNRKLVRHTLKKFDIKNAIIITDIPSYNVFEVIELVQPKKIVYINSHNLADSEGVVRAIVDSEKAYIQQSDILLATSEYNRDKTIQISGSRKVFRSLPGVNFELFTRAFRGDEPQRAKTICFFGSIQDAVDIDLYNQLAKQFKILFIGEILPDAKNLVSDVVEVRPAVGQEELAKQLKEADVIGLFYKQTSYTEGVIPAKVFESMATGKPILVCGIKEDRVYSPYVYHFDGTETQAVDIIKNLAQTETKEKIENRRIAAMQADWQSRFQSFCDTIFPEDKDLPKFSVLMSVYNGDSSEYFREAMDSIINQMVKPDEVVLVKDGPVSMDVDDIINEYISKMGDVLKIVSLEENKGLGAALAEGIKNCTFELVARMDADDINSPDRFEKQLRFLKNNPDIDVVSCFVAAFESSVDKVLFVRRGSLLHEQIAKQFRFRFCMNHPASMLRKSTVLEAGNYISFTGLEDYHLWVRMLLKGARMANIGQVLYYHRWQRQLLKRRSGVKRASQQIKLQREFLRIGFVTKLQFLRNITVRSLATVLPVGMIRRLRIFLGI